MIMKKLCYLLFFLKCHFSSRKPKKIAAFSSFLFFSGTSFCLVWPN